MNVPTSLYAQRRARMAQQLGANGIALIPTAPERPRNRDTDFLYRHDSYFYYLTGFTEPNAWLVVTGDGRSTLFCQPKDLEREIWDGYRLGPDAAPGALGVQAAFSINELDAQLPKLLENRDAVWFPFAIHEGLEGHVAGWLNQVRARVRYGALCPEQQRDLCAVLDEMRLIKDAYEQDIMRRAGAISAGAHVRTMQACARMLRAGKDVREYHLDAELLHEFRAGGSQYPAYSSIVAAGANACVLHYRADVAPVRAGELVLIDAGCELDGYASDITRTFPAHGPLDRHGRARLRQLRGAGRSGRGERTQGSAVGRDHQEPAEPHPAAGHGAHHRAGHLRAPGRGRAREVPPHRHPHRGRRDRHACGLRAGHAWCAGESRRDRSADARLITQPGCPRGGRA
jgi:Xaa-Pro aminopeptidase